MTTTEPDTRTGWDLVTAAQQGDTDAFGQLWTDYRPRVAGYVASVLPTNERQHVDDLTSETFVRAFRAIDRVEDLGHDVKTWLFRIARNLVADHRKSAHVRRSNPVGDVIYWENIEATPGPDTIVPEQRAAEDAAERLAALVAALSPNQQAAIRHRFYSGLSTAETAALMGCNLGAMKAAQHRAMLSLAHRARPARSSAEFTEAAHESRARAR